MATPDTALVSAIEPKTKLSGKVIKTTLAGALVDVGQEIPGVIHISQLQKEPVNKVEDVVQEGPTVEVWVRRVKKDRIELTMIEPLGLEWREIQPDMIVKGKVVRVETSSEVVKEGDEVEAKVLDVDRRKRQIRLSMKALIPEPVEEEKPEREERKFRAGPAREGGAPANKRRTKKQEETYE